MRPFGRQEDHCNLFKSYQPLMYRHIYNILLQLQCTLIECNANSVIAGQPEPTEIDIFLSPAMTALQSEGNIASVPVPLPW